MAPQHRVGARPMLRSRLPKSCDAIIVRPNVLASFVTAAITTRSARSGRRQRASRVLRYKTKVYRSQ